MKNIIIAAGGTGGHIYPALAIADAIKAKDPEVNITFVGTSHGLENDIVPKFGYTLWHLPIGRLHKSVGLRERLTTVLSMPFALLKAMYFCLKLRPMFLLGVGGHASGPMLLGGAMLFFKTVIWEPNALPGLANRILSRFVSEAIVTFDQAKKFLKNSNVRKFGYPVRKAIDSLGFQGSRENAEPLNVLVYMGSQGAQSINRLLPEMLAEFPGELAGFNFIHQTGKKNLQTALSNYYELGVEGKSEVVSYIDDMEEKYKWADLLICRSGMGTLAEISAAGKPSILIPFPYSSDDHQRKNAEVYRSAGASMVVDHNDLSPEKLKNELVALKNDGAKRSAMADKSFQLHFSNSVDNIAEHLLAQS